MLHRDTNTKTLWLNLMGVYRFWIFKRLDAHFGELLQMLDMMHQGTLILATVVKSTFLHSEIAFWIATSYRCPLTWTHSKGSSGRLHGIHKLDQNKCGPKNVITDH